MNNFRALNAKTTHAVISLFWSLLSRNGGWLRLFGPLVETWSSAVHPHILHITWKLWLGEPPDTFRYIDTRFDWVKLNKMNKHETERRKRLDFFWFTQDYYGLNTFLQNTDEALLHKMQDMTKLQNYLKELIPCCPTYLHHTLCAVLR